MSDAVAAPREPELASRIGRAGDGHSFMRRLLRRPVAVACLIYLGIVVAVAILAPLFLPNIGHQQFGNFLAVHQGPSWHHLLGTDTNGRDVLERLLVGARVTMLGVGEALVLVVVLGVPFGLAAGYVGGWVDRVVSWLADLTFAVPAIILILVVLAVFPQSMAAAMATFAILAAPGLMRVVRSATLPVTEELYVAAARVAGLSPTYIVTRHVLPRIMGPVIVYTSYLGALALLAQTGLSYLSLVVAAPAPSWGGMVADGAGAIYLQPWLVWPPGVAIALTILAFGLLGDVVGDVTTERWSGRPSDARLRRRSRSQSSTKVPRIVVGESTPFSGQRNALYSAKSDGDSPDELLAVEGLTIELRTPEGMVIVVEDASFDIKAGETVGLVGESGCGKTITAMSILGLLPSGGSVVSGRVIFDGRDLTAAAESELRRVRGKQIAFVSQEPMISLNPAFRVGVQLRDALRRHLHCSRRQARERALHLLTHVHIPNPERVARLFPHELSGGMAQRVAIARALAGEPKLLIADEPTTALDVTVQAEILQLLRELKERLGMALLLVTHDWGVVADSCDRAVVMYAGQVVERAALEPLFRQPLHPYTEALLASNPQNFDIGERLVSIPGTVPRPGSWPNGCHFNPRCPYATESCSRQVIELELVAEGRLSRCIHSEILKVRK
jgi:peptide/nickel transport system permease protein